MDTQVQKDLSLVVQRIKNARIMNILDIVRKQELVSIAKLMDIAGRSKMTKSQLVSTLNQYIQNNIRIRRMCWLMIIQTLITDIWEAEHLLH